MTHAEALQKAAKLLRLATSTNPHEAALAASRAQEIIDRHNLSNAALEGVGENQQSAEPIVDFSNDPIDNRPARWQVYLSVHLARANQCKSITCGGRLCMIGRPSDVSTIRYFYAMICRDIERITAASCTGTGRTYWNNFRLGMVETIGQRMKAQTAATVAAVRTEAQADIINPHALAVTERSIAAVAARAMAVEAWTKQNLKLRAARSSRSTYDSGAREAGRIAGHHVRLGGSGQSIGSGRLAIT